MGLGWALSIMIDVLIRRGESNVKIEQRVEGSHKLMNANGCQEPPKARERKGILFP